MDIDKIKLKQNFVNKNYDEVFKDAREIAQYIIVRNYNIEDADSREDLCQDCLVSLWDKVIKNKINVDKGDLFSFIWRNSNFKILEVLRKKNRRKRIAPMIELNPENDSADDWKQKTCGMEYNPEEIFFYNELVKEYEALQNSKPKKRRRKNGNSKKESK